MRPLILSFLFLPALALALPTVLPAAPDPSAQPAVAPLPASAFADPDPLAPTANAALSYYRAWLLDSDGALAKFAGSNWSDPGFTLSAEQARQLADAEPLIAALLRSARIRECDWAVDYHRGFQAMAPHLIKLRASARLLAIDARVRAQRGDSAGAAERLAAIFAISAHATRDRLLISSLVSQAIAGLAIDVAEVLRASGAITPQGWADIRVAAEALDQTDPFGIHASVAGEGAIIEQWLAPRCTGADAGAKFIALAMQDAAEHDAAWRQEVVDKLASADEARIQAELRRAAQVVRDALAVWDVPDARFRLEQIAARVEKGEYGAAAMVVSPSLVKANVCFAKAAERLREFMASLPQTKP